MSDSDVLVQEARRRVLIDNERRKLAANSLDRLSTASFGAGFIAPIASLSNGGSFSGLSLAVVLSTTAWLLSALLLHFSARQQLGKLQV